ncbi:hypothetical protein NL676_035363 [Syzygium grande]|nr:hypothetical protein NL676_035363 [Syzygium grande]
MGVVVAAAVVSGSVCLWGGPRPLESFVFVSRSLVFSSISVFARLLANGEGGRIENGEMKHPPGGLASEETAEMIEIRVDDDVGRIRHENRSSGDEKISLLEFEGVRGGTYLHR